MPADKSTEPKVTNWTGWDEEMKKLPTDLPEFNRQHGASYGPLMMDTSKMIFVFGSNLAGRHGAGAAKYAHQHRGAVYGQGIGLHGGSWALPTMDRAIRPLSLETISWHVERFLDFARDEQPGRPFATGTLFQVTCIGCGLGGQIHSDIAPMFENAPDNCWFDTLWKPWLGDAKNYWGTF